MKNYLATLIAIIIPFNSFPASANPVKSNGIELLMAKFCNLSYKNIRKFKNSDVLFKEADLKDWKVIDIDDSHREFQDKAFVAINYAIRETVVVFKGSEPVPSFDLENIVNDWGVADFNLVIGKLPKQFYDSYNYLQAVKRSVPDGFKIYMTGHSLGGSITELLCALEENKNITAYTFNAYGVKHLIPSLENKGFKISSDFDNINNYSVSADLVSNHNEHIGNVFVVKYNKNFIQTVSAIISETPKVMTDIPYKIKKSVKYYFVLINKSFVKVNGHLMNNFVNGFEYEEKD